MGVPTFYRWLVTRYPKIAKATYETRDSDVYARRTKIKDGHAKDRDGNNIFRVPDLSDYVNNTDETHCSDNINGYFDNLYLDMNGIIHLCSHSDNSKRAKSNEEIFLNIFLYIERLFDIIEPKKLLYMAIDGVAPKAKMNQQRSRRFKSILCSEIERNAYIELREKFLAENRVVPDEYTYWDSNIITPGTQFMYELSVALKYFVEHKITNDDKWKNIIVIFSDANVCGEGEHKIFNFIKSQRAQPGYDPNIRHVIHGMDADLIMLSLASHEPYFYILREIIVLDSKGEEKTQKNEFIGMLKSKEDLPLCTTYTNKKKKNNNKYNDPNYANINKSHSSFINSENWNELQILDLTILREYLSKDFFFDSNYNLERCIDDFIFICFLCGNDFLPHLPSISIAAGSIDQLVLLYQKVLPVLGDYLINEGKINLKSFSKYVSFIAEVERETFISQYDFKKKREKRDQQKDSLKRVKCADDQNYSFNNIANSMMDSHKRGSDHDDNEAANLNDKKSGGNACSAITNISTGNSSTGCPTSLTSPPSVTSTVNKKMMYESKIQSMQPIRNFKFKEKKGEKSINFLVRPTSSSILEHTNNNDITTTQSINGVEVHQEGEFPKEEPHQHETTNSLEGNLQWDIEDEECKRTNDINEFNMLLKEAIKKANECENPKEDVELGGDENPEVLRIKYYKSKFHLDETDYVDDFVKEVVYKYIEGLAWVLSYYFQSCPMWQWYYPYYYAPLSSDLIIDNVNFIFEKDEPILPLEQLLCVLPSNSSHCLPKMYRELMVRHDSPIIDFYPKTFKEEENGKKYKYQWVILLPFVDKERIIKHARELDDTLTEEEKKRNRRGMNRIYMNCSHSLSKQITKSIKDYVKEMKQATVKKNDDHNSSSINNNEEYPQDEFEGKENYSKGLKEKSESNAAQNREGNPVDPMASGSHGDGNDLTNEKQINEQNGKVKHSTNSNGSSNSKGSDVYNNFFKNMNLTIPISNSKDFNLFGYLNCKHEDSDVNVLKKIFKFSSNFATTCNSAFFIQPEFKKHRSSLLPNHRTPRKVLTVLDINNEERKLRFNAPAAKRMILNSLSANHPHIYSYSKHNQPRTQVINYSHHNSANYANDHRLSSSSHAYGNYGSGNYGSANYANNPHNTNNREYWNGSKNHSSHHHGQNYQNANYGNNYPPLTHKNSTIQNKVSKNAPPPHTYENKKESNHNNSYDNNSYTTHRNSSSNENSKYDAPINTSYNGRYRHENHSSNRAHGSNRNYYTGYGNHGSYNTHGSHNIQNHSSYKNYSGGHNISGYNNYGKHNNGYYNETNQHKRDSFKSNMQNSGHNNATGMNKKGNYNGRSMPYKDREY
ncbi:exoribonuclease [Plasmodium gonderi]|uniref:Exoribonuclease n=1 Tax=Plasmodium gonderi TaxID=77519 RepID=A0A1Y1JCB1_PLAGO|nr:exoribonuclease [Plasmodium gonderi]GAW80159.1 exoribonuclease [Plasmodium gonderi]